MSPCGMLLFTNAVSNVLYREVSFAQGVIGDHAPLTIVASYAGATMKSAVLMKDLLRHESRTYLGYVATVSH